VYFAADSWVLESGNVDVTLFIPGDYAAHDGNAAIDLDGEEPGSISQTFACTGGQEYTLSYWMSGNTDGGTSGPWPFNVTVVDSTGADLYTESADDQPGRTSPDPYKNYSANFTATGGSTHCKITIDSHYGMGAGPMVDAVCIVPVVSSSSGSSSVTCPSSSLNANLTDLNGPPTLGQVTELELTVDFTPGAGYTPTTSPPNIVCQLTPTNLKFRSGSLCTTATLTDSTTVVVCDFGNVITPARPSASILLDFYPVTANSSVSVSVDCSAQCSSTPSFTVDETFGHTEEAYTGSSTSCTDSVTISNAGVVDLAIRSTDGVLFGCRDSSGDLVNICAAIQS